MGLWLAFLLYKTRYAMLDDSLIHLRYAAFLHNVHHITFDGVHSSFGTSSLLYVNLLALFRGITTSVFLPKIVSTTAYLVTILILEVLLPVALRALSGSDCCSRCSVQWQCAG
jgi:hypothetical protein